MSTPQEAVIDRLVEAYNAGDARALAALFAPDAAIFSYPGQVLQDGAQAIEAEYAAVFKRSPGIRTEVAQHTVVGSRVVDLARVRRDGDAQPMDVLTIYTVENDRITRVEYLSAVQAEEA